MNPGPTDEVGKTLFPPFIQVEDQHKPVPETPATDARKARHLTMMTASPRTSTHVGGLVEVDTMDLSNIEKVHRFPRGLRP